MSHSDDLPVDVETIMTRIRQEAARRAVGGGATPSRAPAFNRAELFQTLNRAEQNARVGTRVPEMNRFNRRVRWLARAVARTMIYLTQVITTPQRMFNQSVIQALHLTVRLQDQQIERLERSLAEVARGLCFQQREMERLAAGVPAAAEKSASGNSAPPSHLLDPLYVAFEDHFRGTPQDVRRSLEVYLPLISEAGAGKPGRPVLDLGCGRGEWLALLAENGLQASGVDSNRLMVQACSEQGVAAREGDLFDQLRQTANESLGAVTAFHLVEHLSFDNLVRLLDEMLRVLRPGGLVIVETPNARNLLVSGGDFYRDPTHHNPLHPDSLAMLARSRGYARAEAYFLDVEAEGRRLQPAGEYRFEKLMDYVRVSRDFALVGYRP